MGTFSLLGSDTIKIGERILADFCAGEIAKVSYASELATVKTGKNGNTIYVQNASGFQASLELKVIRGSADDKFLQSLVTLYRSTPTAFVLQNVELVKKIGDGAGTVSSDTYSLVGGIPTKQVEVVVNVEGDTDQALSVYTWVFATSDRAIA
jgi:hypothetical protein